MALAAVVLLLAWLNGPGWRWLGGMGLRHALSKAQLEGEFQLKGSLLGGIRIEGLSLSGGVIRKLEIGSAAPLYRFDRAIRGEIDGLRVDRVSAIIDLDAAPPREEKEEPPFAPRELAATLERVRTLVTPMDLRAAELDFRLVRGGENLVDLGSSRFSHEPGSGEFHLDLGTLAVGPGHEFPAQESVIRWTEGRLALDRFDVTPRLGISGLEIDIPEDGALAGSGSVKVEDSVLEIDGGLSAVTLRLEGEPLKLHEAARNVAVGLPFEATLDRLEARIDGFDLGPDRWNAGLGVGIASAGYEDWELRDLSLALRKENSVATVEWSLEALGGPASGSARLQWRDLAAGAWTDFAVSGEAGIPRLAPVFAALRERFAFAPADAPPLPASSLKIGARADSGPDGIRSAELDWNLSGEAGTAVLTGEVAWKPGGPLTGKALGEGLGATFGLDFGADRYEGTATLSGFRPETLAPWAAAAGVSLPTGMTADATWRGEGAFGASPHRGEFDVSSFEWARPGTPPLLARTKGSYAWPDSLILEHLTATAEGQTLRAEARLADGTLGIPLIEWLDGETRLVGGRASIPVPRKTGSLRDFLAQREPISVFLESEWIDHRRLAAWLPDGEASPAEGAGRLHLIVTGSPAEPKIDLEAALRGIRMPDRPEVPVTDATLTLDGSGDDLVLTGEVRPTSYPAVALSGKMPFKPGLWAENPGLALEEKFEARANIPRLDLATFRRFLPGSGDISGTVEGFFAAGGTLGSPDLSGELRLSGGAFTMGSKIPPVSSASALVRLRGKEISLENLTLESAGGTLRGRGSADLTDATDPALDLSLTGTSLPLWRDESMILRADLALALRGSLREARLSGGVDLVDSLFYRDFEIIPVRMPFTAPSRPSLPAIDPDEKAGDIPEPFSGWGLDVRLRTRDPLLIRGNLAEGQAVADIRFGGTLGNIRPEGSAIIEEATARLPFSTLRVRRGRAVFTPDSGLNPELNIRGGSDIGRYNVNVWFYGPLNSPRTALTSDPPLPESEIMTLLATGTTSDGLEGGEAATLKAAQLLVEEWRRGRLPFAEQVADVLAILNRVDLRIGEDDPLTGRRLNSATIELHDRWYVSGSIDKQSHTRALLAFVIRFK